MNRDQRCNYNYLSCRPTFTNPCNNNYCECSLRYMNKELTNICTICNNVRIKGELSVEGLISGRGFIQRELFNDDFSTYTVGPNGTYNFFGASEYIGNDATVINRRGLLEINPNPQAFTLQFPNTPNPFGGLDHVKYLVYKNGSFTLPIEDTELVYEATISGRQTFDITDPIPNDFRFNITNINEDLRLCCGGLNMLDPETWMIFDCFLTNSTIYAFYERLPFGKPQWPIVPTGEGDYQAFSSAIPIAQRQSYNGSTEQYDPLNDFVNIKIAINKSKGYVRWLINDVEKLRINRLGFPVERRFTILDHGGPSIEVSPRIVQCGFGLFTLLDMTDPVDSTDDKGLVQLGSPNGIYPNSQYVNPKKATLFGEPDVIDFITTTNTNKLFGQGFQMKIKNIRVYESKNTIFLPS